MAFNVGLTSAKLLKTGRGTCIEALPVITLSPLFSMRPQKQPQNPLERGMFR